MSGPYRVAVTAPAQRDLRRLPDKVSTAIVEFMTTVLPENPLRLSKPLTGDLAGYRSARRGDYRVLIRVHCDARYVYVIRVAHRAHAYRPR